MKKLLGAFVALSAASTAFAQSSVQLYGVVDLGLGYYKADDVGHRLKMISGGNQNSRIGFRGREDLGGGLYAGFELEAGLFADSGIGQATNTNNQPSAPAAAGSQGITFSRKSYVNLGGRWGELRLGRDYVPSFWPLFAYDPFRTGVGLGAITTQGSTVTQFRASNSIGYYTPGCSSFACKGFFLQAMYALGENASNAANPDDGRVAGLRTGYGGDKWDVSIARTTTKNAAAGDFTQTTGGGALQTGFARLMVLLGEHKTGRPVAALGNGSRAPFWQVGAWIYAGPGYFPIGYTRVKRNDALDSTATKFSVGYVHLLSKRTALYTTYSRINNDGQFTIPVNAGGDAGPTPIPGGSSSGLDLGVRHSF